MTQHDNKTLAAALICLAAAAAAAGPYAQVAVNGYVGDDYRHADPLDADARVNPIFRGWATGFADYLPADNQWSDAWNDPNRALGAATGDNADIVSLGELEAEEIAAGKHPGRITCLFGGGQDPDDPDRIRNVEGCDFVIFENAFISEFDTAAGSVRGRMLAELARVEVSSNGVDFSAFPCVSLVSQPPGPYGTVETSDVCNLAGRHPNAYGICTGTPFDLEELAGDPNVLSGLVDLDNISRVRITDVPGSGDFHDDAPEHTDPSTWPNWSNYTQSHPIHDAWATFGSGGFDLEAVGVLKGQAHLADIDLDGAVGESDLLLFVSAWLSRFGQDDFLRRCDLAEPEDLYIDFADFAAFAGQWGRIEQWRQ
jgi:hypothetical protein